MIFMGEVQRAERVVTNRPMKCGCTLNSHVCTVIRGWYELRATKSRLEASFSREENGIITVIEFYIYNTYTGVKDILYGNFDGLCLRCYVELGNPLILTIVNKVLQRTIHTIDG